MRVIVAGCRTWTDGGIVAQKLHAIISRKGPITVVHGACPTGADYYASRFAIGCSSATEERHAADWGNRGAKAGPERNERMAAAGADLLLAFWDGQSPGTLDMIRRAVAHCIPVQIVAWGEGGPQPYRKPNARCGDRAVKLPAMQGRLVK